MSGTIDTALYEVLLQIATNTSGGGSNVTIVGPKGSQNTAGSVAVALATDQVAIPVNATIQGTPNVAVTNTPNVTPQTSTSGGSTPNHAISTATTNATSLKGSAGNVYGIQISNTNAAARFFKMYNTATTPTVGTTPIVKTVQVLGNSTTVLAFPEGLSFTTGIAYAATANMADADTTAIGAGDLAMEVDFK